jgi:molybdate transport system substrate-binding protein
MSKKVNKRSPAGVAFALLAAVMLTSWTHHSEAAEVKVLSAFGAKLIVDELIPEFERASGHKVTVAYGQAGAMRKRILDGEPFDLTILPAGWNEIQGKLVAQPLAIVHADLGMAVRAGDAKPDTDTADGLKRTLRQAKSIVYTDPKTGGISGVLFAKVLQQLEMTDEVNVKSKLVADVFNAQFVADGHADLAVQHAAEIAAVPGVQFVKMPPEFRSPVVFSGALAVNAREPGAARAMLDFLTGPGVVKAIKAKGYEPH